MQAFNWITLFALAAALMNGVGILTIYKNREFAERNKEYFMCFAAGVLIAAPLLHALPEAFDKSPQAGVFALAGFLFMFFSNKVIQHRTHEKELAFGITAVEGIGIHSFIDGIIYSVTFSASTMTGILAGIGLVAHEFAEGVIIFSVLLKAGQPAKKAAFYGYLVAGLTTPLGAFIVYPLVHRLPAQWLGLALGFVAGVLIYISASHLLPEATEHEKHHSYLAFVLGVLLSVAMAFLE